MTEKICLVKFICWLAWSGF